MTGSSANEGGSTLSRWAPQICQALADLADAFAVCGVSLVYWVHLNPLLTNEAAYRSRAKAVNPHGDGKAAGRIVAPIQEWLAAEADSRSGSP